MEIKRQWRVSVVYLLSLMSVVVFNCSAAVVGEIPQQKTLNTYIVHVKKNGLHAHSTKDDMKTWYESFLPSTSSDQNTRMVHTYHNVATGFAARLTAEEAKDLAAKDGVVSSQPQQIFTHNSYSELFRTSPRVGIVERVQIRPRCHCRGSRHRPLPGPSLVQRRRSPTSAA